MTDKQIRVVSILSPTRVVINCGAADGVKVGQQILIYGLSTNSIKDIGTDEDLGKIEIIRGRGKIIHVQEKISTLESSDRDTSGRKIIKTYKGFQTLMNLPAEETVYDNEIKYFDEVQVGDYGRLEEKTSR